MRAGFFAIGAAFADFADGVVSVAEESRTAADFLGVVSVALESRVMVAAFTAVSATGLLPLLHAVIIETPTRMIARAGGVKRIGTPE